jgi:hypothetical protein
MHVFKFLYHLKKVESVIGYFVCAGSRYENYSWISISTLSMNTQGQPLETRYFSLSLGIENT